ncbi:alpha/beta fold hydrolase [Polaromonas sp.]|uniref:alpha/beta fold hydrolase n=1 Tax=Polaromonas sp. TaxID=1869339 RepID=UPI002FC95410
MSSSRPAELQHGHFEVDDVRLHYVKCGAGPLLLCLHGFPQHWYAFRHILAEFGKDHTVVAVDLRGVNLSSRPSKVRDNGVWVGAEDMLSLVENLGFRTCTVIGHDWGGAIAYSMALHRPEVIDRLVILSASHPATFERELHCNVQQIAEGGHWLFLRSEGSAAHLKRDDYAALKAIFAEYAFFSGEDRAAYLEAWRQPGAVEGMTAWYRKEGWGPSEGDTPAHGNYVQEVPDLKVSQPTLVIYGDADRYLHTGNYGGLDAWVKDLEIHRIRGASHWILDEHPELINSLLRPFLAKTA